MSNTWFTSDHHFYHNNILKFENRPYSSVAEMNEGMIDTWNKHVGVNDTVYHMGDMVFGGYDKLCEVASYLNGNIHLILGNHDRIQAATRVKEDGLIAEIYPVGHKMKIGDHELWLSHFPLEIGLRPRKWSIHGHIHSEPSNYHNQLNVGVDSPLMAFKEFGVPLHIDELQVVLEKRTPVIEKLFLIERG